MGCLSSHFDYDCHCYDDGMMLQLTFCLELFSKVDFGEARKVSVRCQNSLLRKNGWQWVFNQCD